VSSGDDVPCPVLSPVARVPHTCLVCLRGAGLLSALAWCALPPGQALEAHLRGIGIGSWRAEESSRMPWRQARRRPQPLQPHRPLLHQRRRRPSPMRPLLPPRPGRRRLQPCPRLLRPDSPAPQSAAAHALLKTTKYVANSFRERGTRFPDSRHPPAALLPLDRAEDEGRSHFARSGRCCRPLPFLMPRQHSPLPLPPCFFPSNFPCSHFVVLVHDTTLRPHGPPPLYRHRHILHALHYSGRFRLH
jgi:hypothetical protein